MGNTDDKELLKLLGKGVKFVATEEHGQPPAASQHAAEKGELPRGPVNAGIHQRASVSGPFNRPRQPSSGPTPLVARTISATARCIHRGNSVVGES
jgi:hypothetical protein